MSDDEKDLKALEREEKQKEADVSNAKRSGVGTRVFVGSTRGKGSLVITWEQFDDSKPETLPKTIQEFTDVTGSKDQSVLLGYLIAGFNEANYIAASDPLAEFVEDSWPADAKTQFRLVVRNYARGANVSLEDAVALIKPGFAKQFKS